MRLSQRSLAWRTGSGATYISNSASCRFIEKLPMQRNFNSGSEPVREEASTLNADVA
jgi:hypothetical protein